MFGFWQITLAVAAAAASIPIIIHLLNRRRYRIVTWAAMRFLLAAQKQNTRRMRLEQIILLAVRILVVLLVVLAMASVMPWAENVWARLWPDGVTFTKRASGRTHRILVLDASLSMNQLVPGGKTAFERARELALRVIKDAPAGDGFSVALMKEVPGWVVGEASQDARKVLAEVELLQPTHGNASVAATLNMVAAKAGEASNFKRREVYFFTDMQKATWLAGQSALSQEPMGKLKVGKEKTPLQELQSRARTIFVDVGQDQAANLAVTSLVLDDSLITSNELVLFSGSVKNYSQEARRYRVGLLVGKAGEAGETSLTMRVERQEFEKEIKPGDEVPIRIPHRFSAPGTYVVQLRLLAKDGQGVDDLDADNYRSIVVTVRDETPVMVVNGKPAVERFDRATEYLRLALNPFPKEVPAVLAPLRPKVVSLSTFADAHEGDLATYDCVFLCDVGQLGGGELRRLEGHLRRGGGVIIGAGEQMANRLDFYNRILFKEDQGILPARLLKKVQAPGDHHFVLQGDEDAFKQPPLKAFADDDDRGSLRNARFRQYLQVKPAAGARVIMTYMPEVQPLSKVKLDKDLPTSDPAFLEWNPPLPRDKDGPPAKNQGRTPTRFRGKVVLVTSTLNMDWNSWPGSPSYAAMMQELTRLSVAGKRREKFILVNQTIEEYLPSVEPEIDVLVSTPSPEEVRRQPALEKAIAEGKYRVSEFLASPRKKRSEGVGELAVLRWADTELSGIYLLAAGRNAEELPVAVNVPTATPDQGSESDLSRASREQLGAAYPGWDFQVVRDPRQAVTAQAAADAEEELVRSPIGPEIARFTLLAVLALLFLEVILAWVFSHYSGATGVAEAAATGRLGPVLVSMCAAVIFLVGAFALIQAVQSHDFLSFWPVNEFRSTIEAWYGVAAPAAGESRHWALEARPYLMSDANSEFWLAAGIALLAALLVFFIYRAEGPETSRTYKVLLGGLRLFLILLTLAVLLPRLEVHFDRQGWPDVVLLIDDSRSMGEPDHYQDDRMLEAVKRIAEQIKKKEKDRLPEKIKALQEELDRKTAQAKKAPDSPARLEAEQLTSRLQNLENQLAQISSPNWRPTRLQLIQALLAQPNNDWLQTLLQKRRMKLHIFHLDANGRAIRLSDAQGQAGEITLQDDPQLVARAHKAIAGLEAEGKESRLGSAIREVLDQYRGSSLSAVLMFTDGVTTRDETIAQVSDYAAQKAVPLFFVGVGDDHPIRDLKLHDLQVADVVYVNDNVIFQAQLTGQGYKDLTVPVVLKVKEKDGKEIEVDRKVVQVDPTGKSKAIALQHKPTKIGRKLYVMEVELPKVDRPDKAIPPNHTRLERTIDVLEAKLIRVLYVEGTPRYEFRFIKSLLERERADEKKNRSVELKVVLLDADADFPAQDRSALPDFPATREELERYDLIILGDCDPRHPKLGDKRLRYIADFVRGEDSSPRGDARGKNNPKSGGGLLMIAGPNFSPHAYRDTPLAAVLPVEPVERVPPEAELLQESYRLLPTGIGLQHPIFRFINDDAQNQAIWQRLPPLYWFAQGYRIKPLAEVLAVHPFREAEFKVPGQDHRHPLAVQQFVGSGRCLFFGFDETWRWRLRDNEPRFNNFWIETVRYLSRNRITRTVLRLDRQTPYRVGEPIRVSVRFPDNAAVPGKPGAKVDPKTEVRVMVEYRANDQAEPENSTLKLDKTGNWAVYENFFTRTREGKYRFWLSSPDVSKEDPSGEKPSAEARVESPPGELDRLRMNQEELTQAAEASHGRFYTLVNADELLEDLPTGARPSLNSSMPPLVLWNSMPLFALVLFLFTSEWLLRKRKHML